MALPLFPQLQGMGWDIHKKPIFSTLVAPHSSGREVRTALWLYPLWEFEVNFPGLAADGSFPGLGGYSLQALAGLYLQCQGQAGTFVYVDPSDNNVVNQNFASGDGVSESFTLTRAFGSWIEPVGQVTNLAAVYVNNIPQTSGWSLSGNNQIIFATPPAHGVAIAATFSFGFICRFLEDEIDFEAIAQGLWAVRSVKFRSVRSS